MNPTLVFRRCNLYKGFAIGKISKPSHPWSCEEPGITVDCLNFEKDIMPTVRGKCPLCGMTATKWAARLELDNDTYRAITLFADNLKSLKQQINNYINKIGGVNVRKASLETRVHLYLLLDGRDLTKYTDKKPMELTETEAQKIIKKLEVEC